MNDARIEQALRLGPPEPAYRPVDVGALLAGGRGGISVSNVSRRVLGGAVVLASAAVIVAVVVILGFRPSTPPLVGVGPSATPTAVSPVTPSVAPTVAPTTTSAPATASVGATSSSGPSASPASSPTSLASAVAPSGCHLAWSLDGVDGAAGSRYINVTATNDGTQTCGGFSVVIGVTLAASDGSVIAESDSGNGPMFVLDPGKRASGFAQWNNWCGTQAPTHLRLTFAVDLTLSPVNYVDFVADTPPCTSPGSGASITPIQLVPDQSQ